METGTTYQVQDRKIFKVVVSEINLADPKESQAFAEFIRDNPPRKGGKQKKDAKGGK